MNSTTLTISRHIQNDFDGVSGLSIQGHYIYLLSFHMSNLMQHITCLSSQCRYLTMNRLHYAKIPSFVIWVGGMDEDFCSPLNYVFCC